MSTCILKCGAITLMDECDLPTLETYSWRASKKGYAIRKATIDGKPGCMIFLHRVIMGAQKGQIVDHINGDKLDNRRENLRFATNRENIRNSRKYRKPCSSQFKGVCLRKSNGTWRASIWMEGRLHQKHLGNFKCEHEAAHAYNKAAIAEFGDFAVLNPVGFPKESVNNG